MKRTPTRATPPQADPPRLLAESVREIAIIASADGQILQASSAAVRTYGFTADQFLSLRLSDLDCSEGGQTFHRRQDGSRFPVEIRSLPMMNGREEVRLHLVTDTRNDLERLQTAALASAANPVMITDRTGCILWVNPACERMTGYTAQEIAGLSPRIFASGQHNTRFYARMWEVILSGGTWHGEVQNRRKDGTLYVEELTITPVRDEAGTVTHFIAVKQDVTARKQQEERLIQLALHDPLTGLLNRRAWEENLDKIVHQAQIGRCGALLLMDLDRFKSINDTHGLAAGDHLLRELARCISTVLRREDAVARIGGDEFAAIMYDVAASEAAAVADRLRGEIRALGLRWNGRPMETSISIGVVDIDGDLTAADLLEGADAALYRAKELGRNRIAVGASPRRVPIIAGRPRPATPAAMPVPLAVG